MNIKTFYCNPYRECTYILYEEGSTQAIIIDPGMYGEREDQRVLDFLHTHNLTPEVIFITHNHQDHVCGLDTLKAEFPEVLVYANNPTLASSESYQLSMDGETELHLTPFSPITIIPTPGHKDDAISIYFRDLNILFTGDTLFQESIGRTDLPGGDMLTLCKSLARLKQLPDSTDIYPGHGYTTTIGHEKEYNPYL